MNCIVDFLEGALTSTHKKQKKKNAEYVEKKNLSFICDYAEK